MIDQKFLLKLFFSLCLWALSLPSMAESQFPSFTHLANQFKIEAKPKSTFLKHGRVMWQYSATASPLSLAVFPKIPPAFQRIDAFHIDATAPIALPDLLSSNIHLKSGDELAIRSLSIRLKQARLKAHGNIKYFSDDDWVGKIAIEAHNVDKYLDELLKSGAIQDPHGMTLKFILSGLTFAESHASSKNQPLKIVIKFKDKMLWTQDLPVYPISMLQMRAPSK